MVKFFQALGYTVGNTKGKSHRIINSCFLLFSILYILFSVLNLKLEEPSLLMLLINMANLMILILNNLTDLLKLSDETHFSQLLKMLLQYEPIASVKIFIEVGIILTMGFLLLRNEQQVVIVNSLIKDMAYLVLVCTGVENIIDFLGRLYDVRVDLNESF